jgi:hypothetical protein
MSSFDQDQVEDGVFEDVESPSMTLVPVAETVAKARRFAVTRPDASFVAQLIATDERLPQTTVLRRAAPADALSAYRAFEHRIAAAGLWTRQTI